MANIPCPPYYSLPTHEYTPVYKTSQFVRHYNDWYRCLVGPYCNAPSFLGYSPPGEGELWAEAWTFVNATLRFDCNPSLDTGTVQQIGTGGMVLTRKPTNAPTTRAENPAVISGVVWYDVNGDGLRNDPNSALTTDDFITSEKERGAGVGNLKVLLRKCGDDDNAADLGVTYTFPSGMNVNRGQAAVFDAAYLQEIQTLDYYSDIGAGEAKIGYYSFKILPNQIPGEFYLVFQSPMGYKLTGGDGVEWEVGKAALSDKVVPMVDEKRGGKRELQEDVENLGLGIGANETINPDVNEMINSDVNETIINDQAAAPNDTPKSPTNKPTSYEGYTPMLNNFISSFDFESPISNASDIGPITHSGYYSRSRCIPITATSLVIDEINAGMATSQWPLVSFQYASFVLKFTFYEQSSNTRQLQENTSLECREYQKMKSEGIPVEDIWGCETPIDTGPVYNFEELKLEEGVIAVDIMESFLSLGSGEFTLKNVGLTYQNLELLKENEDNTPDDGALLRRNNNRNLQNAQIASLELGFRVKGESAPASEDELTNILLQTIADDTDTLLSTFKTKAKFGLPDFMQYAGEISTRRVLTVPKPKNDLAADASVAELNESGGSAFPLGAIIGVVLGIMLIGLIAGVFVYRKMRDDEDDSDSDSSDYSSSDSDGPTKAKRTAQTKAAKDFDSDDSDSLSSRWYSDYDGSDAGEEAEEFDVKEAFYGGLIKPMPRPSMSARSTASSDRRSRRSSRQSQASTRTGGSSRGSGRLSTGMSRVSSAVSQGTQSAASSARSGGSRSRFSSGYSKSTRSSIPSKSTRSSSYANQSLGNSRSTGTHSSYRSRTSYPSRTSQSTRSQASSYNSKSTHSRSYNSKSTRSRSYNSSKYSQPSSYASSQRSQVSMSSDSMATRSKESQSTRSPSLQGSFTSTEASSRGY